MKKQICFLMSVVLLVSLLSGFPAYAETETDTTEPSVPEKLTSSEAFIEILKKREGFSKYPYKDNSQWSVGYGTRCPDDKLDYYKKYGITEAEAVALMMSMLADFENAVLKFGEKHGLTFTQNQFDALVSFSYNCGTSWLSETTGNMYKAVTEGWTGSDFLYAICLWSKSAGEYILINRRLYEANMYVDGIYETPYNHETGNFRYVFLEAGQGAVRYLINGFDIRDPKPIRCEFTKIPTGLDESGTAFTYEFAGWYTQPENGVLVENLDNTMESATVLYAMWKDSAGNIVYLPKGTPCENISVTVTNVDSYVNVRSGPGTYYEKIGKLNKNTTVPLKRIYNDGTNLWGQFEGGWFSLAYSNYNEVVSGTESWPKSGFVNANNVNVRSGPGKSYQTQYQLDQGAAVTITEQAYADDIYWGKLQDGNWMSLTYVTFDAVVPNPDPEPAPAPENNGDVNGNGSIDKDDAIYLLRYVVYPEKYPITVVCDFNKNGTVDKDDAIYLLRHIVYPEKYPLK